MVPPSSDRISRVPPYSRTCISLPVRGCHPLRPDFPDGSGSQTHATGLVRFRSPLLTESRLMSFPPANEMFQFAGFASHAYGFSMGYPKRVGCPIRKSSDQRLLPSPRSLSQSATSFIASRCQGIHQMPFSRSRELRNAAAKPLQRKLQLSRGKHCQDLRSQMSGTRCQMSETPASSSRHFLRKSILQQTQRVHRRGQNLSTMTKSKTSSRTIDWKTESGFPRRGAFALLTPPALRVVEANGLEPMPSCLQSRCSPN